jgi:hypothetical protein
LPRKYHRPPAVKRRKSKKAPPFVSEGALEPDSGDGADLMIPADEFEGDDGDTDEPVAAQQFVAGEQKKSRAPSRHLVIDHGYVRSEVVRTLGLAAFLIVSLVITAILRN